MNYDKEKLSYVMCQTSASHTFGNVTACVQNWLLKQFPDKLFNTIHVHSKIAHRQLQSTGKTFLKKTKPIFVIRPRVDWNNTDTFLYGSLATTRTTDIYSSYGDSNLQQFIFDANNKLAVKYQLNRMVMTFDVVLIFSTMMEQMNMMNYIMNVTRIEKPFNIETYLESYIPEDMMKIVADCAGIPLRDKNGSVKDFIDYVNSKSLYPISYKLQGSTQTYEFYRYYPVLIDTLIMGLNADDGNRNGQIISDYQISFSMRCEFNSTGFYYVFSDKIEQFRNIGVSQGETIVPIFTDVMINEDLNLADGWVLYNAPICRLDNSVEDSIDITGIFNSSLNMVIKYHIDHGIPIELFLDFKIRQQGKLLDKGINYTIDIKNMKLTFHHCSTFYTYKILTLVNIQYVNELIKELNHLE